MPISSPLAPEAIVGNRPRSIQSAQSFISGGTPLGSSVVASAANKIVGFQRANVRPVNPDINSIVKTISSNILNQVETKIQNATALSNRNTDSKIRASNNTIISQIQQIKQQQGDQVTQLQNTVQNINQQSSTFVKNLVENYKKRINDVESAKPTNILQKFLGAYKDALGFIQFFADRKRVAGLRTALKTLQTSFTESFEIAKLIRQTILKIVSQLSNLPQASPGRGSGLNLDVNVPQQGLKKTGPRNVRFGGRGAGLLGLGLGAVGATAAVNALSDREAVAGQQTSQIPDSFGDRFSAIVDRFATAIDEMIKGSSRKSSGSSGSSSSGGTKSSPSSPSASPGSPGMSPGSTMTPGDAPPEIKALMDAISSTEGTWDSVNYGKGPGKIKGLENMTIDQALKASDDYIKQYGGTGTLGRYQHHPDYLRKRAIDAGLDPKTALFTPENQSLIQRVFLDKTFGGEAKLVDMVKKKDWEGLSKKLGQDIGWPSLPGGSQAQPGYTYGQFGGKIEAALKQYVSLKPPSAKSDQGMGMLEGVDPSMVDLETKSYTAQKIAQPPPSQAGGSQVSMLPLDLTGGQQSGGGGGGVVPSPPINEGPTIPLLPSSDPDNFMTMYSKLVYNIVDG